MSMDTYGIIGFTTDNDNLDRRFYWEEWLMVLLQSVTTQTELGL